MADINTGNAFEDYKFPGEQCTKTVHFLVRSKLGWITWKQTEGDLFWFFERSFAAIKCQLKQTPEEGVFGVELELPASEVPNFEKQFKSDAMSIELDKIHGLDPSINYKKQDAKLYRLCITQGLPYIPSPENSAIHSLEKRLGNLEGCDKERNGEVRGLFDQIKFMEDSILRRLKGIDEKVEKKLADFDTRIQDLEKAIASIKK